MPYYPHFYPHSYPRSYPCITPHLPLFSAVIGDFSPHLFVTFRLQAVDHLAHLLGTILPHRVADMTIPVHRKRHGRMTERIGDGLDVGAVLNGQSREGVPQIVEPGFGAADLCDDSLELLVQGVVLYMRVIERHLQKPAGRLMDP